MKSNNTAKIKKEKTIYHLQSDNPFTWKDFRGLEIEDDDVVTVGFDGGHYSENNSWDPHYYLSVVRMVEETDEQYETRIRIDKMMKESSQKRRYESYLKLKEEFEPNTEHDDTKELPEGNN
jgi:hypothetical protein